ncbi:protein ENHANCED DISEASE RESISTANCE 2-like [Impatiens glandulifera]|uniref:protein ENHANCED DISEASE RESISTANCE 2-like n=1 Tax=Impatiens glandulifera TaxID=253017 RepID=UPI001FB061C1|nr:protein ENHANCED DISEASE RESISTANCE 2-like [Impatiens glandulifera]
MANTVTENESDWIKKVKAEGAVPFLEPDNCPNGWSSPPPNIFMVRGPQYFSTKVKIPASDYLLKPLGFDWIKGPNKISEALSNPKHRIRKVLNEQFPSDNKPLVWAFNLQVPSKENYSAIAYFVSPDVPNPDGSLLIEQFLKGDDVFRNSRLKLIANIVKGPWIVKRAVGERGICVIGRALVCKYCVTNNFLQVDIDIGSSMVAKAIVHLAFGYITTLTVDLAFLIESQTDSELPERILGAVRFSELNPASAMVVDQSGVVLQSSLSRRLWWSLGQGFSSLLHPVGPQESSLLSPGSSQVNGGSITDDKIKTGELSQVPRD